MDIDKHVPGRPVRFVLSSPVTPLLTSFYADLFGWQVGDGVFTLGGRIVAEFTPGHGGWLPYLTVGDVAAAARDVIRAGGHAGTLPVQEADPAIVVTDPGGTSLGLAEATHPHAIEVMAEAGAGVWIEQKTHDQGAATAFLGELLGVEFAGPSGPGAVRVIMTEGGLFGGVMQFDDRWATDEVSHWLLYLQVADTDEVARRAVDAGGSVWFEPFETPLGRMTYLRDPAGNALAAVQLSAQGAGMVGVER